jgi:hypothetical protein
MARFLNQENQFVIPNYLGGIHEEVDSSLLKSNEAAKAQNCDIDKGVLKASKGLLNAYGLTAPKALMTYYQGGDNSLIAVANGIVYKRTGSTWTSLGSGLNTAADRYDFINDNIDDKDLLVFTNGADNVKLYDGTTLRDLKKLGKASAASADNVMKGKYILMHYERLWIADDNSVYASSVTRDGIDIEDFTTPTDEIEVNQHGFELSMYGADGKIIGMSVVFDDIIIWKERTIHKIFGTDPNNYQKINFAAKGGISDKSVGVHETGAYFIDHNGINHYDGTNVRYISKAIEDTWSGLDKTKLGKAVGFISGSKYIVAVCEGSSTVNNLIIEYDIFNKNFMFKRGFNIEAAVEFDRKPLVLTGGNDIFEYNAGTPSSTYWETGFSDLGLPEATKEINTIYLIAAGTGNLKITVTTEKGSKEMIVPLYETGKAYQLNTMVSGRMFKVRIENTSNNDFTARSFKLLYELDYD